MPPLDFQISLPIGKSWRNVELLRSSILNCLAAIFQDSDFCQTVSMMTAELLENAIKYGDWSGGDPAAFGLKVHGSDKSVEVEVTNPIAPAAGDALVERVAFIDSFDTPEEAYFARLRQVAELEPGAPSSGLGLVRVAHESGCKLSVVVKGGVVTVRAVATP